MTDIDTISSTTAVRYGSEPAGSSISTSLSTSMSAALLARSDVLFMTQEAENAVLKPMDSGGWPHSLRAALAARVATQNELPELALHYTGMITDNQYKAVTDTANNGKELNLTHVLAFMDSVTVQPRDITANDVQLLQDAAVSDADIVRLTELNAFMAYQMRLIIGLKLLSTGAM